MIRTNWQNKRLHELLSKLAINPENKADLVNSYTCGRTTSSKDMTFEECEALICKLVEMAETITERENREKNELMQKTRRDIFKLMYDCGFISNDDSKERKNYVIKGWISKKMNLEKELNDLTYEELIRMTNQLQAVRRRYQVKSEKKYIYN
jgi:hypothetical protein